MKIHRRHAFAVLLRAWRDDTRPLPFPYLQPGADDLRRFDVLSANRKPPRRTVLGREAHRDRRTAQPPFATLRSLVDTFAQRRRLHQPTEPAKASSSLGRPSHGPAGSLRRCREHRGTVRESGPGDLRGHGPSRISQAPWLPTWVLSRPDVDWRWETTAGTKASRRSAFYPQTRLFRHPHGELDWVAGHCGKRAGARRVAARLRSPDKVTCLSRSLPRSQVRGRLPCPAIRFAHGGGRAGGSLAATAQSQSRVTVSLATATPGGGFPVSTAQPSPPPSARPIPACLSRRANACSGAETSVAGEGRGPDLALGAGQITPMSLLRHRPRPGRHAHRRDVLVARLSSYRRTARRSASPTSGARRWRLARARLRAGDPGALRARRHRPVATGRFQGRSARPRRRWAGHGARRTGRRLVGAAAPAGQDSST